MTTLAPAQTGSAALDAVRIGSDRLTVAADGMLEIDGHRADDLLHRFGSPLNVAIEGTLRANYRRIRDAFAAAWPGPSHILYAIKANSTLAVRAILSAQGAGGDCFGLGELQATLRCGTDPALIALNGSDKRRPEIEAAVAAGAAVNVDGYEELDVIEQACRFGRRARVNLRIKVLPPELDGWVSPLHPSPDGFVGGVRRAKWGYTVPAAIELIRRMQQTPCLDLTGLSCHVGHLAHRTEAFVCIAAALAQAATEIHAATGFIPRLLDIGGGWAPERDPSFRHPERIAAPIESVARAVSTALLATWPPGFPVPALWIEPGRYLVGNATVLLATAGAIKRDAGLCWMHVDASTNNLPRIESGHFHYAILPASRMHDEATETVEIVGGTCFRSVLGAARPMPPPRRGDLIAILDGGMYAEAFATQFNSVPRPATVLLSSAGVDVVRMRETIEDVFRHQRLPSWLNPP